MSDLAVVHTIARLAQSEGGPARSVAALCRSLSKESVGVEIVTGDVEFDARVPVRASGVARRWGRVQPLRGAFERLLEERIGATRAGAVHDHGIWLDSNRTAARVADRRSVARIVSPRGMLSEWSLAHRGWRKRIAWRAYQRRDLETADALHATSDLEAEEIRAAGIGVPIAILPNGVELPPEAERDPAPPDRIRRFLFLSRIHPQKGLEALVEAWRAARPAGCDPAGQQNAQGRRADRAAADTWG